MRHALRFLVGPPLALAAATRQSPAPVGPAAEPARDSAPLPPVTPAVRALAGCYRLDVARPGLPLPPVVRLDTVAQRTYARGADFRAGPDVTTYHDFPSAPGWRPVPPDSLVVSWFDGFAGTTLQLRRSAAGWRGVGVYSSDDVREPVRRAEVAGTRVACTRRPRGTRPRPAARAGGGAASIR